MVVSEWGEVPPKNSPLSDMEATREVSHLMSKLHSEVSRSLQYFSSDKVPGHPLVQNFLYFGGG